VHSYAMLISDTQINS